MVERNEPRQRTTGPGRRVYSNRIVPRSARLSPSTRTSGAMMSGIGTMTQPQRVADFVQRDRAHAVRVELVAVADVRRERDVAARQPSRAVGAPRRRARLLVEVVGPANANVRVARRADVDEAKWNARRRPVGERRANRGRKSGLRSADRRAMSRSTPAAASERDPAIARSSNRDRRAGDRCTCRALRT